MGRSHLVPPAHKPSVSWGGMVPPGSTCSQTLGFHGWGDPTSSHLLTNPSVFMGWDRPTWPPLLTNPSVSIGWDGPTWFHLFTNPRFSWGPRPLCPFVRVGEAKVSSVDFWESLYSQTESDVRDCSQVRLSQVSTTLTHRRFQVFVCDVWNFCAWRFHASEALSRESLDRLNSPSRNTS